MDIQKNTVKDYLKLPYHRVLVPAEEGGFFAEILEFPGCFTEGDTPSEAYQHLEEVAAAWIEGTLRDGESIPPPATDHSYGGKFALRLPRDLHRMAAIKAERDSVSLNSCFVSAIAAWVGADNLFERIAHRIEMNFVQANFFYITPFSGEAGSWFLPSNAAAVISLPPMKETITIGGARG
jgi:predicted RNase H-like HicB family nuclease